MGSNKGATGKPPYAGAKQILIIYNLLQVFYVIVDFNENE